VVGYIPKTVTHPGTNRAQCRETALINANALPLGTRTSTSVPNFNLLARLESEIRRGSQNKKVGVADPPGAPSEIILYMKYENMVPVNTYHHTKMKLPVLFSFQDTEGRQNLMWGS